MEIIHVSMTHYDISVSNGISTDIRGGDTIGHDV